MPFILRGIKLWGIDSISISIKRREFLWNEMVNLINFEVLEKYAKIVGLEGLLNIFPDILKGEIAGRVLVDVKK
jgi:alcohol dehydrogenase/acrylyl-CoA reductase (NADPH)